ncbi:L-lactate permease [Nakamurella multipartita]|uniref:L-lactate permease n=1 Tax=Nakamurella multipartita (strain ATCC 700099 / DSM 44233 / CIP 104796 / JCM 9543 / NBRC 105858 / Y-104) TaxID=479431 RepID=C8XEY5_NAKMY|nr:L-lactate permease [Nakamurella multipartita]ACV79886.1 L-lactate transport [Nakamurella multipartita DSM 44233]
MATPYTPDVTAVGDSLFLTAMVSIIPLLVVFVFLGILKTKAHWAGLAGLASAILVAILAFGMPVDLTLLGASQGILYGLFPIMWIVLAAIWLYELTVISGRFEDLRTSFNRISDDPRIQGIIIAFCFGGLLEALAGFGAPVAITGVMLVSLGFSPMRAAATVLLANTAPVAFGAIGIPIITAGNLTGIDYHEIGAVVGRQTPILAMFVPLLLVMIVDGKRGLKQTWPIALVSGVAFSIAQFISSNYISVELTDIIASLAALIAVVAMLKFWKPKGTVEARERLALAAKAEHVEPTGGPNGGTGGSTPVVTEVSTEKLTAGRTVMAFLPYIVVIVVFSLAKLFTPLKNWLASTDIKFGWPGSDGNILTLAGKPSTATQYTLGYLSNAGTLLIISGVIVMIAYRIKPGLAVKEFGKTVYKLRFALLTVGSVLGLAYVMNMSGQTITIGQWLAAGTGAFFAFLSPILGWVGTAVTGSDTSANALFATLQQSAAEKAGLDPTLLVAANTSGGVVGKMISPQNLTIAATAVGLLGRESDILRRVLKWSVGLLLAMCVLVYLQSNVLAWMIP